MACKTNWALAPAFLSCATFVPEIMCDFRIRGAVLRRHAVDRANNRLALFRTRRSLAIIREFWTSRIPERIREDQPTHRRDCHSR
jgi:hypothetical protein